MGMPARETVTTIEELLALPEDGMRHELLDGEHVVTPAPSFRHQAVLSRLFQVLHPCLVDHKDVGLFWSPADIYLGLNTLVQPDLFIVRIPETGFNAHWRDVTTPLLAIEVLSPGTASRDRGKKRRLYLDAGVEEYWIVDIDARLIERWRPGDDRPQMVDHELEWKLVCGISGTLNVQEFFKRL